jgi:hypothetical protein
MDQDQHDYYIYHSEYTVYVFDPFDIDPFQKIANFLVENYFFGRAIKQHNKKNSNLLKYFLKTNIFFINIGK